MHIVSLAVTGKSEGTIVIFCVCEARNQKNHKSEDNWTSRVPTSVETLFVMCAYQACCSITYRMSHSQQVTGPTLLLMIPIIATM